MKREFLQSLKVGDQPLPKDVIDAIMAEHGKGVEAAKGWEEKYKNAVAQQEKALADLAFSYQVKEAITAARGKNPKAIMALMDMDALRQSEDRDGDIEKALGALQASDGYLFDTDPLPPPYARGTGAHPGDRNRAPATLAEALRERNLK